MRPSTPRTAFPSRRWGSASTSSTEQLEIITGLWGTPDGQTFSFSGAHYQLSDSPALPKPAQQPRPPVILGGAGARRTPRLAARFADEFNLGFRSVQDSAAAFGRSARPARLRAAIPPP